MNLNKSVGKFLLFAVFAFLAGLFTTKVLATAEKVYVCKYVGTPGTNERLQTGQNPIEVSTSSIQSPWSVGSYFNDQHGRSYVLNTVPQNPEPKISDCPPGDVGYHTVCSENACVVAEGEGENTCDTNVDCRVEEDTHPSMSSEIFCGSIKMTFVNPTNFFFSFDYRVDNEAGHDDQYSSMNIANGPYSGMSFGQRFNEVDVNALSSETRTVSFDEDSGIHTVSYRLWRGAENDWYLGWQEKEIESDCKSNEEEKPVPTPLDVCANIDGIQTSVPDGYHLDAGGRNCVQFTVPGSENSSTAVSTGSVLGASTMAGTGVVEDSLFYSIFTFGSLLTSLGIMKNGKKRN